MNGKLMICLFLACIFQVRSGVVPQVNIDADEAEACMKGTDTSSMVDENAHVIYPSEVTTKYFECALQAGHYFTKDGEFDSEYILGKLASNFSALVGEDVDGKKARQMANELYAPCNVPKGENNVEKLVNFNNCVVIELQKKATA
ncbi:uncharacterized protein LOC116159184 [Photinus pyralis]|uniref:Uncharacterized protein n=1 Tax=Photinus pyralis TaxID=7054 RepID=A0A1Y1N2C9_PHOPY|nr:uncharacterized protein LOC116159184 [Photinus pyralis]